VISRRNCPISKSGEIPFGSSAIVLFPVGMCIQSYIVCFRSAVLHEVGQLIIFCHESLPSLASHIHRAGHCAHPNSVFIANFHSSCQSQAHLPYSLSAAPATSTGTKVFAFYCPSETCATWDFMAADLFTGKSWA